jgi:hypothetical protein
MCGKKRYFVWRSYVCGSGDYSAAESEDPVCESVWLPGRLSGVDVAHPASRFFLGASGKASGVLARN